MIKQDPNNYRSHDDKNKELIKKSLEKLGAGRSIVIDNEGYIVAGNGVHEQAEALGIPVRVVESDGKELIVVKRTDLKLGDEKRKELALADNATSDTSEWDADALFGEWGADQLAEWGVELPEWDQEEIEPQEDCGPGEVPEQPNTVFGDLYELNEHRVLCGDSTDSDTINKICSSFDIDIVFTDPDYSMEFELVRDVYANILTVDPRVQFWVCADKQAVQLASQDIDNFSHFYIHNFKIPTLISNTRPMQKHNMVCVFGKASINNLNDGFSTIIEVASERTNENRRDTRMAKRVELPESFITHYTQKGVVVLDVFAHSGSTLIACEKTKRVNLSIDISERYIDVVVRRWVKYMKDNDKQFTVKRNGEDITGEEWLYD